jgi:hypothetical protein
MRDLWYELAAKLNEVSLKQDKDVAIWMWTKSEKFSIKSVYEHATMNDVGLPYSRVWMANIPDKSNLYVASRTKNYPN